MPYLESIICKPQGFCVWTGYDFLFVKINKLQKDLFPLGQQDDARMNISIALTAARRGANVCNHTEVIRLLRKKIIQGNVTDII